ncbi:N-6 DNA methylase [bacterium]|nr:N-6 DNA methylase [bacterium]
MLKKYKSTTFDESDLNTKLPLILEDIQNTSKLNQKAKNAFDGLFSDFREILNKLSKDNLSLRNKNLLEILQKVNDMPLSISNKENNVEFADAFEYLITMFGLITNKEAKSFFTPYNVSKLLIKLALFNIEDKTDITIYDPTCGSGSLMLKILKYIDKENIEMFYGQDKQNQAFDFCRMNMLLHLIPYDKFDIKCGNTLANDLFKSEGKFDIIVSHPPLNEK